jgi:uncharacterized protein (TIGR00645 family)
MERFVHSILYASRWVLAPIYFGLIGALVAILLQFYSQIFSILLHFSTLTEAKLVLQVLGLVDLTLIGGLILMVMLSGYENFISNQTSSEKKNLGWLGKLDASSLKVKVAVSLVAISSIHLLQVFMEANKYQNAKVVIYIALHLTFVASACLMGFLNKQN